MQLTTEDVNHLVWIYDRLSHVHNENVLFDYMTAFNNIISKCYAIVQQETPSIPQKLPDTTYTSSDISDEEYRVVITNDLVHRIDNPKTLVLRKGGSTHRVIDQQGLVHCYAAPETGKSILQWKARPGKQDVIF